MRISRRSAVDVALLVLVNAMWAGQFAAYKVATQKMGPVTVSTWTFLIASFVLLPFLSWERRHCGDSPSGGSNIGGPGSVNRSLLSARNALGFLVIGVFGLIPASAFLAWGIDRSTASNAAVIYLTIPIITALLASVMLKERMTLVRWGSLFVALTGVLILSDFDWRHLQLTNSKFLFGNILVLLACSSSSFYNVSCKGLLRRFRPVEVLVCTYTVAFVVSLPVLHWAEPLSLAAIRAYRPATWIALIMLSVFTWGLAMILWLFLLTRLDVSQASVSVYLLSFLGVLFSAIAVHEHITLTMVIGGLVTLAGTVLVMSLEPTAG